MSRTAPIVNPTTATLKQFAVLAALVLAALAIRQTVQGRSASVFALGGLAVIVCLFGLLVPVWIRPIFVGLMMVTYPLNWLISRLLLACLFYGVFTPLGLLFRLIGRDSLTRSFRPDPDSYWIPKATADEPRSYFRTG